MNRQLIYSWYEQYKIGIFRYALSILKDPVLSEDVLQETFLRLLAGKEFPEPGKEQAWLYRVARNQCYDILRKQKRMQKIQMENIGQENEYAYIEIIASLDRKEQEIVTLKIIGGLDHKEISQIMGLTVHASKKRYERAIHKLREMEE